MDDMNIHIGSCGWSYQGDWDTIFYPPKLKSDKCLEFYSKIFSTVEIDSSFYYIPPVRTLNLWLENSPSDFRFSAKINQEITHKAKLDLNQCHKQDRHPNRKSPH